MPTEGAVATPAGCQPSGSQGGFLFRFGKFMATALVSECPREGNAALYAPCKGELSRTAGAIPVQTPDFLSSVLSSECPREGRAQLPEPSRSVHQFSCRCRIPYRVLSSERPREGTVAEPRPAGPASCPFCMPVLAPSVCPSARCEQLKAMVEGRAGRVHDLLPPPRCRQDWNKHS